MADVRRIMSFQLREISEIFPLNFLEYAIPERWIYQCHAAAFETCSTESPAIDSICPGHYVIYLLKLR